MVDHDTWLVPTLSAALGDEPDDDSPEWKHAAARAAPDSFRLAHEAGVRIAMGTDCPVHPHGRRLDELALMHRLGMAPAEVWRAATAEGARLLDRDDIGRLDPGRRADVVAVSGDVFVFDGLADRIETVWKDGRAVPG